MATTLYKTIRLIDLIDTRTQPIEDLYAVVSQNLNSVYNKAYPVQNIELWNDFIERLVDRYFNRFLSFDTYYTWSLKLKYVLEQNKEKYIKIYENSMREINPLLTFSENEKVNTNRDTVGDSQTNNNGEYTDTNHSSTNYGRTDTRTDDLKSEFKNTTDSEKSISGLTTNPKSQSGIAKSLDNLVYIDSEQINENTNNYHNSTTNTGTQTNASTGTDTTDTNSNGNNQSHSENSFNNNEKSIINRLRDGFNGNQLDMLQKYVDIYFDVNKEIIEDIDRAKLFMSVLC